MKPRIFAAIAIVLLIIGALGGVKALQIRKLIASGKSFVPPPETVSSVLVRDEKWQGTINAIGSVTAVQGVMVTPDIPGAVREIAFEAGAVVDKGDLLVRLDTSAEVAQLAAIQAQAELARLNLARVSRMRAENIVPQSELDAAESALKQYESNADVIRAAIEKKTIRAPFAGQLGIRLVNLGQYLETGKPIVSLQSLESVYVEFSLPQQELSRLKTGMPVRLSTDTYPGQRFDGTLTTINPGLDQSTRSVNLQATLANADHRLRPGMFARVQVVLPAEQEVLVIPATSVLSAPYGNSVYVIDTLPSTNGAPPTLSVRQQFVRTGMARGDFVSVESGLKAGDRIVNSGLFKLRNGMAVVENNSLSPKPSETPRPPET
jgi:membrane fusion protein (multidrug efflux system)